MTQKGKFLKEINEAFARSDMDFIIKHVTDDVHWTAVGDFSVNGKDEFIEALKKMENEEPYDIDIKNIITHGDSAAVDGEMKSSDGNMYAFCDVYKFSGFKNPEIKEMTSYVVELKKNGDDE